MIKLFGLCRKYKAYLLICGFMSKLFRLFGNKDGDIMKRKSFGKLAIVMILAVMMLLSLCVCSKKAEKSTTAETTVAQTSTPATTPAATTTTTTSTTATAATSEKEEAKKVEETKTVEAPVEAPVETVVETPVETVTETATVEDAPLFSTLFSYEGIKSGISAYKDHATISIPSGVTDGDIKAIAELLVSSYPEASEVTYSVVDGNLVLEYPEIAGEYISEAVSVLVNDAKWLIDTLKDAAVEVAEEEAEEENLIKDTYSYHGLASASVVVADTYAEITYPKEYIYKEDVDAFMAKVAAEYPVLAENITYDVPEDGTLVLYYSADFMGGTYYKLEALSAADEFVTAYIDNYVSDIVVKAAEKAEKEAVQSEEAINPVFMGSFDYKGYESSVIAFSSWAVIEIPEGVSDADIAYLAGLVVESYNIDKSQVSYEKDGSELYIYYPEQTDDTIVTALALLEKDAIAIIDKLSETAVADAPKSEEKAVEEPAVPVVSPVTPVVAVTEKGDKVYRYSVAITANPKFNLSKAYKSPFHVGFGARFEAEFGSRFGLGIMGQFETSNYLALGLYGKYTFLKCANDKLSLYGVIGGGAYLGVASKSGREAALVLAGIGADYHITENISLFGELDFAYAIKNPGAELGLTIGGKYTF